MRYLSSIILLGFALALSAQSPHGPSFEMDCAACHTAEGWEIAASFWQHAEDRPSVSKTTGMPWGPDTLLFNHNKTEFPLTGNHIHVDCRQCHQSLVFSEATMDCNSCHEDMHRLTVGTDCARCHSTDKWLIDNMVDIHQQNGFPLAGVHNAVSCEQCHVAATELQFMPIGNACIDCHLQDYQSTTVPDHRQSGFSTDCLECHDVFTPGWETDKINHDFFPLTKGHDVKDCSKCHIGGDFANTPNTCNGCHSADFAQSTNPNHSALGMPTDCAMCHTTDPGWTPAIFPIHDNYYVLNGAHSLIANECASCHNDNYNNTPNTCNGCHQADYEQTAEPNHGALQFSTDCATCHTENAWVPSTFDHDGEHFPIYSGAHNGEWSSCTDCHTNPSNYMEVTCINCHVDPETTDKHVGINGYIYDNSACLSCHPNGDATTGFDHNQTDFPLTGAHLGVACLECHANGYAGTPTACSACHTTDFNQTTNPNHTSLNFPMDCAMCHTTEPDWQPALFPMHDDYYPITGGHLNVKNDCAACHHGDYNNTPNTCFGCHSADYNNSDSPEHATYGFPTDCELCHSNSSWNSGWNHDVQYFPIFSGKHNNKWDQCIECHTTPNNFEVFNCIVCHSNAHHQNQGNAGCYNCHPDGRE